MHTGSQLSPELEERGGFAQENSGCWMLKATERDRGWFWWPFTVSDCLLVDFLVPSFPLQHILYGPSEHLKYLYLFTCIYLHLLERRVSLSRFHIKRPNQGGYAEAAHCGAASSHCPVMAWMNLAFFWDHNLDFLTLHSLRAAAQVMHHMPSLYRERTWPLSAESLGVKLWIQLLKSTGLMLHCWSAFLLKISIPVWSRRLCRR